MPKDRLIQSVKEAVQNTRSAPARAIATFKAHRAWQKHVLECQKVVYSETVTETDYKYVIDKTGLSAMITQLAALPKDKPYIGFDMGAKGLGHESPLCLIQIRDYLHNQSYLVDLLVLDKDAFKSKAADGKTTLKSILEDPNRQKLIFDARQDSCTLFANAGIKLQGVMDLQIMYMLTSDYCPGRRTGLKKVVELTCNLDFARWNLWNSNKDNSPGQHWVWENRPLAPEHRAYALGDVDLLGHMYDQISARLNERGMEWAQKWSAVEVQRT